MAFRADIVRDIAADLRFVYEGIQKVRDDGPARENKAAISQLEAVVARWRTASQQQKTSFPG